MSDVQHYDNLPIQYTDFLFQKQKMKFSLEIFDSFNIFAHKHRLWVHVRTHNVYMDQK